MVPNFKLTPIAVVYFEHETFQSSSCYVAVRIKVEGLLFFCLNLQQSQDHSATGTLLKH